MSKRRQFSGKEKVAILRRHLLEGELVSDLCDRHNLHPNVFYRWQKEFFSRGEAAFEKNKDKKERKYQREIKTLKAKIAQKDEVIAEIIESNVRLKKKNGESF